MHSLGVRLLVPTYEYAVTKILPYNTKLSFILQRMEQISYASFFFCLYRPMKPAAPAKIISTQAFKCQMRLTLSKNHDIDDDVDDFIRLKSNGKRSDFSHMEIQCMLSSVLCIFIRSGILLHPQMDKKNYQSLHLELVTKTYMPWLTP